jgi:hypothetical protein
MNSEVHSGELCLWVETLKAGRSAVTSAGGSSSPNDLQAGSPRPISLVPTSHHLSQSRRQDELEIRWAHASASGLHKIGSLGDGNLHQSHLALDPLAALLNGPAKWAPGAFPSNGGQGTGQTRSTWQCEPLSRARNGCLQPRRTVGFPFSLFDFLSCKVL